MYLILIMRLFKKLQVYNNKVIVYKMLWNINDGNLAKKEDGQFFNFVGAELEQYRRNTQ